MKNIRINAFIVFFCGILFLGCSVEPGHPDYQIGFNESECKAKYELWKNNRPASYSFLYEVDAPDSIGSYGWIGKVIVKENAGEVQFIRRDGSLIEKDSSVYRRIPKQDDKKYIDSIDDLFEEILNQYNIHKSGIDNENYWWVEYNVNYNSEKNYPEKVYLAICFERPPFDENGKAPKGYGDDVYFHVKISDFTILE